MVDRKKKKTLLVKSKSSDSIHRVKSRGSKSRLKMTGLVKVRSNPGYSLRSSSNQLTKGLTSTTNIINGTSPPDLEASARFKKRNKVELDLFAKDEEDEDSDEEKPNQSQITNNSKQNQAKYEDNDDDYEDYESISNGTEQFPEQLKDKKSQLTQNKDEVNTMNSDTIIGDSTTIDNRDNDINRKDESTSDNRNIVNKKRSDQSLNSDPLEPGRPIPIAATAPKKNFFIAPQAQEGFKEQNQKLKSEMGSLQSQLMSMKVTPISKNEDKIEEESIEENKEIEASNDGSSSGDSSSASESASESDDDTDEGFDDDDQDILDEERETKHQIRLGLPKASRHPSTRFNRKLKLQEQLNRTLANNEENIFGSFKPETSYSNLSVLKKNNSLNLAYPSTDNSNESIEVNPSGKYSLKYTEDDRFNSFFNIPGARNPTITSAEDGENSNKNHSRGGYGLLINVINRESPINFSAPYINIRKLNDELYLDYYNLSNFYNPLKKCVTFTNNYKKNEASRSNSNSDTGDLNEARRINGHNKHHSSSSSYQQLQSFQSAISSKSNTNKSLRNELMHLYSLPNDQGDNSSLFSSVTTKKKRKDKLLIYEHERELFGDDDDKKTIPENNLLKLTKTLSFSGASSIMGGRTFSKTNQLPAAKKNTNLGKLLIKDTENFKLINKLFTKQLEKHEKDDIITDKQYQQQLLKLNGNLASGSVIIVSPPVQLSQQPNGVSMMQRNMGNFPPSPQSQRFHNQSQRNYNGNITNPNHNPALNNNNIKNNTNKAATTTTTNNSSKNPRNAGLFNNLQSNINLQQPQQPVTKFQQRKFPQSQNGWNNNINKNINPQVPSPKAIEISFDYQQYGFNDQELEEVERNLRLLLQGEGRVSERFYQGPINKQLFWQLNPRQEEMFLMNIKNLKVAKFFKDKFDLKRSLIMQQEQVMNLTAF